MTFAAHLPSLALLAGLSAGPLAAGAPVPADAAKIKMKNAADGKPVSITDVRGKSGTLVVFTCNHCPFARAWASRIAELANGYAKKGVGVILVNSNDPAGHPEDDVAGTQQNVKSWGLAVPYVVDDTSAVARAFGATVTPEAFLFDAKGKLAYHGAIDDSKDATKVQIRYLQDALDAVLGGKAPPRAETKSIGCGIKLRS
jgi:hypothetical protein